MCRMVPAAEAECKRTQTPESLYTRSAQMQYRSEWPSLAAATIHRSREKADCAPAELKKSKWLHALRLCHCLPTCTGFMGLSGNQGHASASVVTYCKSQGNVLRLMVQEHGSKADNQHQCPRKCPNSLNGRALRADAPLSKSEVRTISQFTSFSQ